MKMTVLLFWALFVLSSCVISEGVSTTKDAFKMTSDSTSSTAKSISSTSGSTSEKGEEKNWEYDK